MSSMFQLPTCYMWIVPSSCTDRQSSTAPSTTSSREEDYEGEAVEGLRVWWSDSRVQCVVEETYT